LNECIFIRCLKGVKNNTFSDVLFGSESLDDIAPLLAEFIEASGGLTPGKIKLTDIVPYQSEHSQVVSRYDILKELLDKVFASMAVTCTDAYLETNLGQFDIVFTIVDEKP